MEVTVLILLGSPVVVNTQHFGIFCHRLLFDLCAEGQANGAQGDYQKYMSDFQQYMKGQGANGDYQKLNLIPIYPYIPIYLFVSLGSR